MNNENKIKLIMDYLNSLYPDASTELHYNSAFELFVAAILSAQCTDKRVNMITAELFKDMSTPQDFANAELKDLEKRIYSAGFYHNKAKSLIESSKCIMENYGGELPNTRDELMKLPGVGRKIANVVASIVFGEKCFAVDTHVFRVTNRLGLVEAKTPEQVEKQWNERYAEYADKDAHHKLVLFGRYVCKAISPRCEVCELKHICKHFAQTKQKNKKE